MCFEDIWRHFQPELGIFQGQSEHLHLWSWRCDERETRNPPKRNRFLICGSAGKYLASIYSCDAFEHFLWIVCFSAASVISVASESVRPGSVSADAHCRCNVPRKQLKTVLVMKCSDIFAQYQMCVFVCVCAEFQFCILLINTSNLYNTQRSVCSDGSGQVSPKMLL